MASVKGNGSDDASRLRDQYESRIRDMELKHKDEVSDLRANYRTESQKDRETNDKRVHELQDEMNYKLSEKDVSHQKEIESIRNIYQKKFSQKDS